MFDMGRQTADYSILERQIALGSVVFRLVFTWDEIVGGGSRRRGGEEERRAHRTCRRKMSTNPLLVSLFLLVYTACNICGLSTQDCNCYKLLDEYN